MARIIRSPDGQVLEIRTGGGYLIAVGLLCLAIAAGAFFPAQEEPLVYLIVGVFGVIGAMMVFYRRRVTLDREQGRCLLRDVFLVTIRAKTFALDECTQVIIRKRQTDNSPLWQIRLGFAPKPILVDTVNRYDAARHIAKEVAEFLDVPVTDAEDGAELVRPPDNFDENLRDRLRRTGQMPRVPREPEGMRAKYRLDGDRFEFTIRPRRKPAIVWVSLLGVFILLAFFGIFYTFFVRDTIPFLPFVVLLPSVFGLTIATTNLADRGTVIKVLATPESIRLEGKRIFKRVSALEIPADEIEDVVVLRKELPGRLERFARIGESRPKGDADTEGILVRGSAKSVRFGEGLDEDELEWLHAMIVTSIVGTR